MSDDFVTWNKQVDQVEKMAMKQKLTPEQWESVWESGMTIFQVKKQIELYGRVVLLNRKEYDNHSVFNQSEKKYDNAIENIIDVFTLNDEKPVVEGTVFDASELKWDVEQMSHVPIVEQLEEIQEVDEVESDEEDNLENIKPTNMKSTVVTKKYMKPVYVFDDDDERISLR